MTTTRSIVSILFLCTAMLMVGCQGPSYVNVPRDNGDLAFNNPNGRTVRAVVVAAVDGVITQTPLTGPVALSLPQGAEALTYEAVAGQLASSNVIPAPEQGEEGAAITASLEVTSVRVRGHRAEVDAIRAKAEGPGQLVTVHTAWDAFSGWRVTRIRAWRINPNQPGV